MRQQWARDGLKQFAVRNLKFFSFRNCKLCIFMQGPMWLIRGGLHFVEKVGKNGTCGLQTLEF